MTRFASMSFVLVPFVTAFAQDPPDRLERKPKPAEAKKPGEAKTTDKKSHESPTDAEDPNVVRERLAKNMQAAEKKLQVPDPGQATRELQDKILRDIDKLLKRAQNPPPMPPSGSPPPMGDPPPDANERKPMGGGTPPPMPSSGQPQPGGGQSRKERREQQRRERERQAGSLPGGQQPMAQPNGQQPEPKSQADPKSQGGEGMRGAKSSQKPETVADLAKDIWGHLPETMRQEVDHYYREQLMPRYRELVRQYYNRLSEQPKRP